MRKDRGFTRRALLGSLAAPLAVAQQQRPNVLFLVVDDLDCRIGCYGDPVAKTPSIDALAARGVRFDRAYCQYPLCNPTRSSVLSGRYPTSTGVLDNNTFLMLEPDQYTLPKYFEKNGYSCAEFGKIWHNSFNRGFYASETLPQPRNPAQVWHTPAERAQQQKDDPAYWSKNHSPYRNMRPPDPNQYAWANEYGPLPEKDRGQDAKIADDALARMDAMAAAGKPFFLAVGFHKPHVPLKAPKQFFDLYEVDEMPLPADFDTEPRHAAGMPRDEFRQNIDLFAGRSFSTREAREAMRAYYACTSYTDAQIGRLLDRLRQHGLDHNTIIVLWGDHGWHLSEKGMWAKGTLFEVSARGPMLIVDPRKRAKNAVSRRVVQYLDLYPTLVDLAGMERPNWVEGASLSSLLDNPQAPWDKPAYTVQTREWFLGRSVRDERWRYTEWDEGRRGSALFDHDNDPHEMHNLATSKEHRAVVERMRNLLRNAPLYMKAPSSN